MRLRPSVWVLDDSPLECEIAARALTDVYAVTKFLDAGNLLEVVANGGTPGVLVLDWQMPGTSGIEVCRILRAKFDEAELPILILTATDAKDGLVEGLSAGANDFLRKPFDSHELRARVVTLTKVHALHRRAIEMSAAAARALERVEEANRLKDDFLATLSHELRTPLNAILGWTRMLRSGTLADDKRERALEIIERSAGSQAQLIEDLLDTSRISPGSCGSRSATSSSAKSSRWPSKRCDRPRRPKVSRSRSPSIRRPAPSSATPIAFNRSFGTSSTTP